MLDLEKFEIEYLIGSARETVDEMRVELVEYRKQNNVEEIKFLTTAIRNYRRIIKKLQRAL